MGTCIICGTHVDGHVCESHEQDVFFEFKGTEPDQLTSGRYYRGEVDGVADFGVFVNIGEHVTGLLHQSELARRLESYGFTSGETMFVQVLDVRDNGDIDLGWSLRQQASEFRGSLVDDPTADAGHRRRTQEGSDDAERQTEDGDGEEVASEEQEDAVDPEDTSPETTTESDSIPSTEPAAGTEDAQAELLRGGRERATIDSLADRVGGHVRIEGEIANIRQTGGPTVFEVRDETGITDCAAFEAPGVRAYPAVELGDVVRIDGTVERRAGDVQVETERLAVLEGTDRADIEDRLADALADRARPDDVDLLADHEPIAAVRTQIVDVAESIRRAVMDSRPIVVRHSATADGYLAGAALERATLSLIRDEHEERDAEYHYFDRRPLDERIYDMHHATRDVTDMLEKRERHDEKLPLFVFVGVGGTVESRDGLDLLALYDVERVVIDGGTPDAEMVDTVGLMVTPGVEPDPDVGSESLRADGDSAVVSTTALAANVALHVEPMVRDDLRHLPAVSYWRDVPAAYAELAIEAGYDADATEALREAVALEAFYQSYEDKRELIADLLFGDLDIASYASEQFRERVAEEIETAEPHLERRTVGESTIGVLDTDAFTHKYDFPPTVLLLEKLLERTDVDAIVGVDTDELRVRSHRPIDMRQVGDRVADVVTDAGVETRGGRDGTLTFLAGERDVVIDAAVGGIVNQL